MRIRAKLIAALLLVAMVPLVAVSLTSYFVARGSLSRQIRNQLQAEATIQKHRVENFLSSDLQHLALLQSRTALRRDLASYNRQPAEAIRQDMNTILQDVKSSSPQFKSISVLDPRGMVVASTDPTAIGANRSGELFFKKGESQNSVDIFFRSKDGHLMHYLSGPLLLNGSLAGVIVMEHDPADYVSVVQDYTGLGKTGETVLGFKDAKGNAVFLTPLRFDPKAALTRIVPRGSKNVAILTALSGKETSPENALDYRGVPVIAATGFISGPNWGLVVKMDKSEAFSSVNNLSIVFAGVAGGVLLLILVVSILISSSLTRPIAELTGTALAVSAGDLSRRSSIASRDEIGKLANVFNRMTDDLVDAREDLEAKVQERTAELELANVELDGYAHTVSHDLRNPLATVNMAVQTLKTELEGEQCYENIRWAVDGIQNNIEKSFTLIDELLALAEAGQSPGHVARIPVSDIVGRILVEWSQVISDRGIEVQKSDDLGEVTANETHLYQLFSNLIGNAIKHNKSAAPVIGISYLGDDENGAHRYLVRDNGEGIPADHMDKLFVPFFKGAQTGETGIGLATVEKIVGVYGGEIKAYNDNGACFEFTIRDMTPGRQET